MAKLGAFIGVIIIFIFVLLVYLIPLEAKTDLLMQNEYALNDLAAQKGFTFQNFENNFLVGITPNVLLKGGPVVFKMLSWENYTPPQDSAFVTPVYEFDIKEKEFYNIERPIWLKLKYLQDDGKQKSIYFYNKINNSWDKLPSIVDPEEGVVKAAIHLPYARLAVLEKGFMSKGVASWYAYKDCDCAASPDYPKGTLIKVTNVDNDKTVVVKINDWGPERDVFPNRVIDLDVVAFEKIGNPRMGLINVEIEPVLESAL